VTPCAATVIIPTTENRGELLRFSVASVCKQTMRDIEILIVGDGVSNQAKKVIAELRREDPRIAFHDFPKHERRGEPYRHQVIKESRGKNIFYLCDRDLMLPYHLAVVTELLKSFNFAFTTFIDVKKDKSLNIDQNVSFYGSGSQVDVNHRWVGSLSCVGHTREMYDRLPFGWRSTPRDEYTDIYMWKQFVAHPDCKVYSAVNPTILYFKRGDYPGDPIEERAEELSYWSNAISTQQGIDNINSTAFAGLLQERQFLRNFRDKLIKERLTLSS
jgi:glycosyltransferase involved in cell wall biosynthesis